MGTETNYSELEKDLDKKIEEILVQSKGPESRGIELNYPELKKRL